MRAWAIVLFFFFTNSYALSWRNLWATQNQQAQVYMKRQEFNKAQELFQQHDWRAAAAYRARDYQQAAKDYRGIKNEQGYYNWGNALANLQQYQRAIAAYDKALAINPHNQDALFNRNLLAELLKNNPQQNKEQQGKQQENEQQNAQQQGPQNPQQLDQEKQGNQQNSEQEGLDQAHQEATQTGDKENKESLDKKEESKDQSSSEQPKQEQQSKEQQNSQQNEEQPEQQNTVKSPKSKKDNDKESGELQLAKEQWLRLIPDDPGGLMREQFLRDHLRRQNGWEQ